MGMFDSVYVPRENLGLCVECGRLAAYDHVEVQFKAYVGRTYEPRCQEVLLGEVLQGFPRIPVLEEWGCWGCRHDGCDHLNEARVRIERAVVVRVEPIERDAEGYAIPPFESRLPQPRSARLREQRAVWSRVVAARREAEWKALRASTPTSTSSLALAMIEPLRARINYASIARRLFIVEPFGVEKVGPYRRKPGGKWHRAEASA